MSAITALISPLVDAAPVQPFSERLTTIGETEETFSPFTSFFNAAMNVVNDANAMQLDAQGMQLAWATGRLDDILAVQMSMDRASNALNFTSQITTRIIEAYREIMRMQI